jgi:hypothetical protein
MLTEADKELITAAVDGDLSPEQQAKFRSLIAESEPAHALYRRLRRDRARLRKLPHVPAPPQLLPNVMSAVQQPVHVPTPVLPRRRPALVPLALAASVLLSVGIASFRYFQEDYEISRSANHNQLLPKPPEHTEPTVEASRLALHEPSAPSREITPPPRSSAVEIAQSDSSVSRQPIEVAPPPHDPKGDFLTSPIGPETALFESVTIRLPLLLSIEDLINGEGQQRVVTELSRGPAFRIDLFVNDPHRAADAFIASAKGRKHQVIVDVTAQDRLKKRMPFGWVILTDSLTPTEIAAWLAAAKRRVDKDGESNNISLTGDAHFVPAGAFEQREWRELVGAEPAWGKRDIPAAPRPLAADTADQVANALQKSEPVSRPEACALLLTYSPREARVNSVYSKEVKLFAERRLEPNPYAVPVMIVIRPANP